MSKSDLQAQVKRAHKSGGTGILRVRADGWPDCDLFFMDGQLIACASTEDRGALGGLLVAAGALRPDALSSISEHLQPEQDLADELVYRGGVAPAAMMTARAQLFSDNLAWASAARAPTIEFEQRDAVFPPNVQLGLVLAEALRELRAWAKRSATALDLLQDATPYAAAGPTPEGLDDATWALLTGPLTIVEAVAVLAPPRRDAVETIARLLDQGQLIPSVPDEPPAAGPPGESISQEDYDRAARGDFIKSYDVLDKVDLSGINVIGADKHHPHTESIPAIEAVGIEDDELAIELGDQDSMDSIAALRDEDLPPFIEPHETQPELAPVASTEDDIELMSDDFAMFDAEDDAAPAPEVELAYEADEDAVSEDGVVAVIVEDEEDAGATGTINVGDDIGVFDREQLNDFHHRIDVFNNIFRIIFRSFSEHIGRDKARQRFNALLGSSQRQYPELFENLSVDQDGSILPGPLVNNLATCPPGDYGSLLHQGLYELIFSHLYDAKDMLPGNAETEMMEQIVVFERQLHQM